MKKGLLLSPLLRPNAGGIRIKYIIDPYKTAQGVIRAMQRFSIVALTLKGSDSLHPNFGTNLVELPKMNVYGEDQIKLFVKENIKDAIDQYFALQEQEKDQLTSLDTLISIELIDITISSSYRITIRVRFYPTSGDAITISLEV